MKPILGTITISLVTGWQATIGMARGVAAMALATGLLQLAEAQESVRLFVQIGDHPRLEAVDLEATLTALGWKVGLDDQDGTTGGLSELRYFYPEDAAIAESWFKELRVRYQDERIMLKDMSASGIGGSRPGQIELWISE